MIKTVIPYLADALDVRVAAHVPHDRPEEFVGVVAAGGSSTRFLDSPNVYVHSYAQTEEGAYDLARNVRDAMLSLPDHAVNVSEVRAANITENSMEVTPPFRYSCLYYITANQS